MERYFLVTVRHNEGYNELTTYTTEGDFVKSSTIKKYVSEYKNVEYDSICVVCIFEFKNKRDFLTYKS